MALTRAFRETVKDRASRDPEFRIGLLQEAVETLILGDLEAGKILLRDYVNSTMGFEALARSTHKNPKSLMRMLSAEGNPRAENLLSLIAELQKNEGIALRVHAQS